MTPKPDSRTYYSHLDGLKGFACLMILLAHYAGIYKYAESFAPPIPVLDAVNHSAFSSLLDEFWLTLFFLISGYLVSKSRVESGQELLFRSLRRFFRFAFPVLFSCAVIYLIELGLGFHNAETASLFRCTWFQEAYSEPVTLPDVLVSPFAVLLAGDARINGPYWVLRLMFFSSLLIYLLRFLMTRWKAAAYPVLTACLLLVITVLSFFVSPIMTSCLAGMLLALYEDCLAATRRRAVLCLAAAALLIVLLPGDMKYLVFQVLGLLFLPRLRLLRGLLCSGPALWLGKLSWGIYSFHWPLICSVGALSLLRLSTHLGLLAAYLLGFLIVLPATLALSAVYARTLDPLAARLAKNIIVSK